MKHLLILCFCIWSIGIRSQNNDIFTHDIDSIIVAYTDVDVMTPVSIPCHKFGEYFKNLSMFTINEEKELDFFRETFKLLELTEEEYIDVRIKLLVCSKVQVIPVCIGQHSVFFNGKYYTTTELFNEKLYHYINNISRISKESFDFDIEKPLFVGGEEMLSDSIEYYMSLMPEDIKVERPLRLLVDFNITQEGKVVDVLLRDRDNRNKVDPLLMNSDVGVYIADLFTHQLRWTSSKYRISKVNMTLPIVLLPK